MLHIPNKSQFFLILYRNTITHIFRRSDLPSKKRQVVTHWILAFFCFNLFPVLLLGKFEFIYVLDDDDDV